MLKETSQPKQAFLRSVVERKVYSFFKKRGYTVCSATPFQNSENWFAVLTKSSAYIIRCRYEEYYINEQQIFLVIYFTKQTQGNK